MSEYVLRSTLFLANGQVIPAGTVLVESEGNEDFIADLVASGAIQAPTVEVVEKPVMRTAADGN